MTDSTTRGVDETFARMLSRPGTETVILLTPDGKVLRSAVNRGIAEHLAEAYAAVAVRLTTGCAECLAELQQDGKAESLNFLRVRSSNREILIVTEGEYLLAVVHKPQKPGVEENSV